MNLTERNDLIQTLLHDLEHNLMGSKKTEAEQYADEDKKRREKEARKSND